MDWGHVIVAQIERHGYQCCGPRGCNGFHRPADPLYTAHRVHASEGETFWTETAVLGIDDATGKVELLPAALGLAALEAATPATEGG